MIGDFPEVFNFNRFFLNLTGASANGSPFSLRTGIGVCVHLVIHGGFLILSLGLLPALGFVFICNSQLILNYKFGALLACIC